MAETNEIVSASDPDALIIANQTAETDEKEVELVESPLVIVNKIIANPEKAKCHANQPGGLSLNDVKRAAASLGIPISAAKGILIDNIVAKVVIDKPLQLTTYN
jgi:hypothetical protein